jgi:signal transduction histidine kinase
MLAHELRTPLGAIRSASLLEHVQPQASVDRGRTRDDRTTVGQLSYLARICSIERSASGNIHPCLGVPVSPTCRRRLSSRTRSVGAGRRAALLHSLLIGHLQSELCNGSI